MSKRQQKPLKRHVSLQPISRQHHQTLLLCWKIRQGFKKGIDVGRIKKYCDWFFVEYVKFHFEIEEKYVFPILGKGNELIKKALAEHKRLRKLFMDAEDPERSLSLLEEELEGHIRFEERVLFQELQQIASTQQLNQIELVHNHEPFEENTQDEFWK